MAAKVITITKGDFTKEAELQRLLREGYIIESENPVANGTEFVLKEAYNFTM